MAYATTLQFAQRSGLGLRIVDETVGTGDSSETDFDLDKGNVIASSYTISGATAGSNSLVALTETTHYTLDKESGRIELTAAGVTFLGTMVLYATYWYTDSFSDTVISDLIDNADDQIDILTGQKWDTATSAVEYYDGQELSGYPTTDYPYQSDYDSEGLLILQNRPVTKVDNVHILNSPQSVALFYNYDAGTAAFTDKTSAVNSSTVAPFTAFDDSPATSDIIYIGSSSPFLGLDINLSTNGAGGSPAIDWEYYNGSSWTDITETETDSGSSTLEASGKFTWTYPYGWATTSVNSQTYYWIRGTLSSVWATTNPQIATVTLLDSVSQTLEPRQYSVKNNPGVLHFRGASVVNGVQNVRVDYNYGQTTTPKYITELSILIAALQSYINLSGGSYNDATSYNLGSKSVTIGEVYVNIREVIDQFKKRINEIMEMVGKRADIKVV